MKWSVLRSLMVLFALALAPAYAADTVALNVDTTEATSGTITCTSAGGTISADVFSGPIPEQGEIVLRNGVSVGNLTRLTPTFSMDPFCPGDFKVYRPGGTLIGATYQLKTSAGGGGVLPAALGQALMALSLPVVIASDQSPIFVTVSGVATAANQATEISSLANILAAIGSPLQAGGTVVVAGVATSANQATANSTLSSILTAVTGVALDATLTGGNAKTRITDGTNTVDIGASNVAGDETAVDRLKVNAAIRLLDTSQSAGSQLVAAKGDQTNGLWVNVKNALLAGSNIIGKVGIDPANNSVGIPDTTASGTITTQNLVPTGAATAGSAVAISLNGANTVAVQVTGTYTGALSPQVSVDGATWVTLTSASLISASGTASATVLSGTQSVYQWNVSGWNQVRITGLAAMTGTATVSLRASFATSAIILAGNANGNLPALAAGTLAIGDVGVQYRASSAGGGLVSKVLTTASTNATSAKASAGRLIGWDLCNTTGAIKYLHVHNKASAPTVGTDSPMFTIAIPANSCDRPVFEGGIAMATGIAYSITNAAGDLDNTVTAAGDVTGAVVYQ